MRWSKNTAASLVVVATMGSSAALAVDGKTAGQDSGRAVLTRFGSKDKVNTAISQPMTNSANLMQTVDGSQSFQATLNAPSADKFLEILIQPSGTGDLQQVIISQDTDADGVTDYAYTLPMPVSGVCANGFISCTPGSWSGCSNYTWGADAGNNITAVSASLTDLGGCYCINSSCGSNLVWQNSAIILKDLGGGIVNSLHQNNPALTISSVSTSPVTITYFGQITDRLASASGSVMALSSTPVISTASGYYRNWAQLTTARDSIAVSQSADPNSMYYMMSNSAAARNSQGKLSSCKIDRISGHSSTTRSNNNSGTGSYCTDHYLYIRIHKLDDQTYQLQYMDTGPSGLSSGHANCNDNPGGDGWHIISTVSLPVSTGSISTLTTATFSFNSISGSGCSTGSASVDAVINGLDTPVMASSRCGAGGTQRPNITWSYFFEYAEDTFAESIDNRCAALELDPECELKDEQVDGVVTYQNFNTTGLLQLPSCQNFTGSAGANKLCREWWKKKRTYICGKSAFDFSNVGTRFGKVETTFADNSTNLSFMDPRLGKTGWSIEQGAITLPGRETGADCELGCKTRVPQNDTQTTTGGNVSDLRSSRTSYDIFYRNCIGGVCPVEDNSEEILAGCQCLNNFTDTAVFVQSLRLAGKDNICSSGQRRPMQ